MEIRQISKKDFNAAIQFAISGMHFDWYLEQKQLRNLYGRYFWFAEVTKATQIIAAYEKEKFLGVLLARMDREKPAYRSIWCSLYTKVFEFIQNVFFQESVGAYEICTKEMLREYRKTVHPDGEIVFLAADPNAKGKGIGTALLAELERREKGKNIYLFTDNACTYQFYEHRGFTRAVEKDIIVTVKTKNIPLKCFLFCKTTAGGKNEHSACEIDNRI